MAMEHRELETQMSMQSSLLRLMAGAAEEAKEVPAAHATTYRTTAEEIQGLASNLR